MKSDEIWNYKVWKETHLDVRFGAARDDTDVQLPLGRGQRVEKFVEGAFDRIEVTQADFSGVLTDENDLLLRVNYQRIWEQRKSRMNYTDALFAQQVSKCAKTADNNYCGKNGLNETLNRNSVIRLFFWSLKLVWRFSVNLLVVDITGLRYF